MAYGRLGHVQFQGGVRKAQLSRGGLEGPQGVEGRHWVYHK
jgi:hypothetical protein